MRAESFISIVDGQEVGSYEAAQDNGFKTTLRLQQSDSFSSVARIRNNHALNPVKSEDFFH
jgi:hypothetical protein